jgi:hypothetical protein
LYIKHYREGFETRNPAIMMLISQAIKSSPQRLPDIDAVVATWDYSGAESQQPVWAFCEPMGAQVPKFLIPDQQFWQWPEAKLKPWPVLRDALFERGQNRSFAAKVPKILWRGAPNLNPARQVGRPAGPLACWPAGLLALPGIAFKRPYYAAGC